VIAPSAREREIACSRVTEVSGFCGRSQLLLDGIRAVILPRICGNVPRGTQALRLGRRITFHHLSLQFCSVLPQYCPFEWADCFHGRAIPSHSEDGPFLRTVRRISKNRRMIGTSEVGTAMGAVIDNRNLPDPCVHGCPRDVQGVKFLIDDMEATLSASLGRFIVSRIFLVVFDQPMPWPSSLFVYSLSARRQAKIIAVDCRMSIDAATNPPFGVVLVASDLDAVTLHRPCAQDLLKRFFAYR